MPSLKEIQGYTPPVLHTGKEWYIDFYAFNPVHGEMRRKKIKLNYIKKITERRKFAKDYMNRLSEKLSIGWNPWIDRDYGYIAVYRVRFHAKISREFCSQ